MSKMIRQQLLEQFQRLDEKLLTSEFTFGFELEAICNDSSLYYNQDDIKDYIDRLLVTGASEKQKKELAGHSAIHRDESVHGDNDEYDPDDEDSDGSEAPFEYGSPIFPCTPFWFNRVIKTLRDMMHSGFYTNDSCGFHHHLHFNGMTERDMVWVYCNLAMDEDIYSKFAKLHGADDRDYRLYSSNWASQGAMRELKDDVLNDNWRGVIEELNTNKWRAFRIHPQGTLEWRGPRDFMNRGNLDNINLFYKLFNQLIGKIKTYMDSKVLTGTNITKKEFFQHLTDAVKDMDRKPDMEFISHTEGYDSHSALRYKSDSKEIINPKTIEKLIGRFSRNPSGFVKIFMEKPESIKFFVKALTRKNDIYNLMNSVVDKYLKSEAEFDEKKNFVAKFIETLKEFMKPAKVNEIIREYDLSKYDITLAVKSLRNCSRIGEFKELLKFVIKEAPENLKIRDIEKAVLSLFENSVSLASVLNVLLQRQFVNVFGIDYILRIILWALNAAASTDVRVSGGTSRNLLRPAVVDKIINLIKSEGHEKEWNKLIINLINANGDGLLPYLTVKPSREQMAKWLARNPSLRYELDDDEQKLYKGFY